MILQVVKQIANVRLTYLKEYSDFVVFATDFLLQCGNNTIKFIQRPIERQTSRKLVVCVDK